MITYRIIDHSNFSIVNGLDPSYKPEDESILIAVAEDKDNVIGYWGMGSVAHAGPVFVKREYRCKGVAMELNQTINNHFAGAIIGSGYYTFPSTPKAINLMRSLRMEKMPYEVWRKSF